MNSNGTVSVILPTLGALERLLGSRGPPTIQRAERELSGDPQPLGPRFILPTLGRVLHDSCGELHVTLAHLKVICHI